MSSCLGATLGESREVYASLTLAVERFRISITIAGTLGDKVKAPIASSQSIASGSHELAYAEMEGLSFNSVNMCRIVSIVWITRIRYDTHQHSIDYQVGSIEHDVW
jgi:hypothetical protein